MLEYPVYKNVEDALLAINNLHVKYGAISALGGISLSVEKGKIVTLLGTNGAGKTTTLRAISGLVKAHSGTINFENTDITNKPAHTIVATGIAQSPEGRMIFANLTVEENLDMGAYLRNDKAEIKKDKEFAFTIFPRLKERIKQRGGTLSGGEQQMLAISRALMTKPRLLLLDEPSLGIAPILIKTIFEKVVEINKELGMTILLVEQNAHLALNIAHHAYVMETGRIVIEGRASDIANNEEVRKAYLGES